MSMALAFAQGLVGGFTKNRQDKKAEIETQQSKLDDFTKIVTQGMITAAANGKPFPKELGAKLQKAKTDMAGQKPMDIFGRGEVKKFELNLSKMSNLMGDVDNSDKYLTFGDKGEFKIPLAQSASTYHTDKAVKMDLFKSNFFFLNSVMPYLDTLKGRRALTDAVRVDSSVLTDLATQYNQAKSGVMEGYYNNQVLRGVLKKNLKVFDFNNNYKGTGLGETVTWLDSYTNQEEGHTVKSIENAENKLRAGRNLLKANPMEANTLFYLVDEKNKDKNILSLMHLKVTPAQYEAAGEIAKLKYGPNARPSAWIFYQQQNTYDGVFQTDKHNLLSGKNSPESKIRDVLQASFLSMNLVKNGFLSKGKNSTNIKLNAIRNLIKVTKGNRYMMTLAVAPLLKRELSYEEIAQKSGGLGKFIPLKKVDAMKEDFKIDKVKFDTGYKATFNAHKKIEKIIGLEELNTGKDNDKIGDNLARSMVTAFGGAFNEGGTVTSIWGIVTGGAGVTADRENNTEADFQRTIKEAHENGYLDSSTTYSVIDALKLSVAADMARAIDPMGRLSNQDFQIQLERLGKGSFNSKQQTRMKLQIIQEEFKDKYDRLQVINHVFTHNDPTNKDQIGLSANERDWLTADAAIQTYLETIGLGEVQNIEKGIDASVGGDRTYIGVRNLEGIYYLTNKKLATIVKNSNGLVDLYKIIDGNYVKLSLEEKRRAIQKKNSTQPVSKNTGKNDKDLDVENISSDVTDKALIDFNTNHENWTMESGGNKSQARWTSPDGKTTLSLKWNRNTNTWERM